MPPGAYLAISLAALLCGYLLYGRLMARLMRPDNARPTPACTMADGVDYVKMPAKSVFLIQLLNIAGIGPVYGPILGALYGPWALVWIVLGSIFAGGVHDYFSGMLSVRRGGLSLPDVVGDHLGASMRRFMQVFSLVVVVLVGVVFVTGPARLLSDMTTIPVMTWVVVIFAYYFLATILPIDVLIGRVYPIFAGSLLVMAVGLTAALFVTGYATSAPLAWAAPPPDLPMWPLLFITIACGAISGFHATQSPLMARCLPDERSGLPVFYGAMIVEGALALIWATLGMALYPDPAKLQAAIAAGGPGKVVNDVSMELMGPAGGILAILGVIVLPITSGDTAFRSARLTIADVLGIQQRKRGRRLLIAVPLFALGAILSQVNFEVIWRYFGWANQVLATLVLWTVAAFMARGGVFHWPASLPASFMTAVCATYICHARIGLNLPLNVSSWMGGAAAVLALALFLSRCRRKA
ncbi:carbon starvation protein A [Nitratidesulfovibrio sp. HK-II]|uniref:carbon starvation CstA family protein n=1 Tax=Nitratidesulfovibrio sp. HK-II TaxID=2009266 RepID=UPI000E2EC314|nr:carbon starvation CstA family protein [Nitratidesulfovibrio sp. HK-II]GBO95124.1 carbon starvation protein A [Nitratidesulfovibrio sp. HK-II]